MSKDMKPTHPNQINISDSDAEKLQDQLEFAASAKDLGGFSPEELEAYNWYADPDADTVLDLN
jgi:hypothetical protein